MKMELIAALLHSPDVLFLDEPTIGLDVIAQHNIQTFLRHYQEVRKVTILLTSHYMKDVAALCRRVVIIAAGRIMYDGSLSGIIDRFGGHKIISLATRRRRDPPATWSATARSFRVEPPRVKLRVAPRRGARGAGRILAQHAVEDVSVEDPPLEEVIAEMFSQAARSASPSGARSECRAETRRMTKRTEHRGDTARRSGRSERCTTDSRSHRSSLKSRVPLRLSHRCHLFMPRSCIDLLMLARDRRPGGPSCGSAWKSGWSTGAISPWAR